MNHQSLFFYVLICSISFSCSPRISTTITKKYPPQAPDAPVTVFTKIQDVPPQWEPIGTLDIGDAGFTVNCDSATVFSLAKTETRKAGGNGLLVTKHLRPTFFGSSCHQISGTMMLVSDFSQTKNDSPETITFVQAQPAEVSFRQSSNQLPRMSFMLDAGYNWRTAKISPDLDDFQKHLIKQVMSGFLWTASMAFQIKDYYGIGLSFQQFGTSYETFGENTSTGQTGVLSISDRITYFGPTFAMQTPMGKSAFLNLSLGLGYIGYVSKANSPGQNIKSSGSTLGTQFKIGLSFKIAQDWAIGCEMLSTGGTIFKFTVEENGQTRIEKLDSKSGGESLAQFGITLGIRYYIKSK